MGSFIRVPGVNPDTERPAALSIDPVLAPTGALMLVDPSNPFFDDTISGVPAHGATVANLAWQSATPAVGGTKATLAAVVDSVGLTGNKGKVERTSKGGIHVIFSQVNNSDASDRTRFSLLLPQPIRAYLDANTDHSIFLSLWGRSTRRTTAATSQVVSIAGLDAGTGSFRAYLNENGNNGPTSGGNAFLGARGAGVTPLGNYIKNVGAKGTAGSYRSDTTPTERAKVWSIGNIGPLNTYNAGEQPAPFGHSGSHILYRAYLEDLTISGRTYAQVDAMDNSYYTETVLTPGGRYYGDTFTNPSTLP